METLTLIHVKYSHRNTKNAFVHDSWVSPAYLNGLQKYPVFDIQEIETKEVSILESWESRVCSVSGQILGLRTSCGMVGCKFAEGAIIF